ncbi:MAG TPA: hypothetical protein VHE57_06045 [Mycobacteriales bacterium]|nr:hypothetical protein [Mycobacteriales bacterium]
MVSAEGLMPTAVVHKGVASIGRWPSPGQELPVTVDRDKPERLVIHWDDVPKGADVAASMAQQLAEQMRGGGVPTVPQVKTDTTVTVNGQPVTLGPGATANLGSLIESAVAAAGTVPGMASIARMAGGTGGIPTVSNDEILTSGTPGNATLLGTFPPPVPVTKEGRTGVGLMLNVMIDGRPPYQIQNVYAVPNDKVAKLTPGALLPVKVNPNMANLVAVDWSAVH